MLTKQQISDMISMQRKLNECINPLWDSAKYDWDSAILVEVAEAIDHTAWKWWKHGEINTKALQMELVDIWHFLLSKTIEHYNNDEYTLSYLKHESSHSNHIISTLHKNDSIPKLLHKFAILELGGDDSISLFLSIVYQTGMTSDDLYKQYMGKNILNIFRQDNGYKEGTYIKMWGNIKEDNDYLIDLLRTIPTNNINYGNKLYQGLSTIYCELTKE